MSGREYWNGSPGFHAGVLAAREEAAAKVEAAGCLCLDEEGRERRDFDSASNWRCEDGPVYREWRVVDIHDPRCPIALARQIREGA